MKNFDYCAYTYRHRRAIEYLIDKLLPNEKDRQEMRRRAIGHDVDKLVMYPVMDKKQASSYHKITARHHMGNAIPKTYYDKLEAILDYESAGYTKPDKPLNAFDTISRMKAEGVVPEEICNDLLDICAQLGIGYSYFVTSDEVGMEYCKQFADVTEEMINEDIMHCVKRMNLQ